MPSGYDYSELYILTNADSGFKKEMELRSPQVVVMPKIVGETDVSKFTWTSSNPTVVSVSNGVVTGLASGTATITVSYGAVSYTFDVEAAGEMAIAIKNNKQPEYLEDKKLVFNAINTAIKKY